MCSKILICILLVNSRPSFIGLLTKNNNDLFSVFIGLIIIIQFQSQNFIFIFLIFPLCGPALHHHSKSLLPTRSFNALHLMSFSSYLLKARPTGLITADKLVMKSRNSKASNTFQYFGFTLQKY